MRDKIDLKYLLTISVLLIIVLNSVVSLTNSSNYVKLKIMYGNGEPAAELEVIITKPTAVFACGMKPSQYNILARTMTNRQGIIHFNLSKTINKICIFIKYKNGYFDLNKTNPYSRGYLLNLEDYNYTYTISLDIYPPKVVIYNLSIAVQKINDVFELQDFKFWITVFDNDPNSIDTEAKVFIGNRTFSLAIANVELLNTSYINITFSQSLPSFYNILEQSLSQNESARIILKLKDNEGFTYSKTINITWNDIKIIKVNKTSLEESLSSIISTLTFKPNNTVSTSKMTFSPTNISGRIKEVEENRSLLSLGYDVFIPILGIATIILEYWRRRSIQ
ncbi:MAG: hypothetical protein DRO40_01450 [Thermoprotei archaeon]|nr:MAG: hypothetical protein DRO40_01450 [Thermoprotei archaeon]